MIHVMIYCVDASLLVDVLAILVTVLLGFQIYKIVEYDKMIKSEQRKVEDFKQYINTKVDNYQKQIIENFGKVEVKTEDYIIDKISETKEYKLIEDRVEKFNKDHNKNRKISAKINHTPTLTELYYIIAIIEPIVGILGNDFFKVTEFKYDIENNNLSSRNPETGEFEPLK